MSDWYYSDIRLISAWCQQFASPADLNISQYLGSSEFFIEVCKKTKEIWESISLNESRKNPLRDGDRFLEIFLFKEFWTPLPLKSVQKQTSERIPNIVEHTRCHTQSTVAHASLRKAKVYILMFEKYIHFFLSLAYYILCTIYFHFPIEWWHTHTARMPNVGTFGSSHLT